MPRTHPWATQSHHVDGGYANPEAPARDASAVDMAQWLVGHAIREKRNLPPAVHRTNGIGGRPDGLRITWLGHATTLIQTSGWTALTDPHFGPRASPLSFAGPRRLIDLPLSLDALPPVDVVCLSHDHYDHLDHGTVTHLEERFSPTFVAPLGCAQRLQDWGLRSVIAFDWGEYEDLPPGLRVHCTPAIHFSGRSLFDRDTTLWCSWWIETDGASMYFGGDTAYGAHFSALRERLGVPDVALLPIGAYEPRSIMRPVHVNPEEAVAAAQDLGSPPIVPIHWGTFDLADEPVQAPAQEVMRQAERRSMQDRIHLLSPGQSVEFVDALGR